MNTLPHPASAVSDAQAFTTHTAANSHATLIAEVIDLRTALSELVTSAKVSGAAPPTRESRLGKAIEKAEEILGR